MSRPVTIFYKVVKLDRSNLFTPSKRVNRPREGVFLLSGRGAKEIWHFDKFQKLVYKKGSTVRAHRFDPNPWETCSAGIHGYLDVEDAVCAARIHSSVGPVMIITLAAKTVVRLNRSVFGLKSACRAPVVKVLD